MGTFTTFAQGATVIDFEKFTKAVDLYATMEVDNVDLDPTPYATPLQTPITTPSHGPLYSMDVQSDQFGSLELKHHGHGSSDLGLNPSSVGSNQSDTDNVHYLVYSSYHHNHHNHPPSMPSTSEMKSLLPPTQQQSFRLSDKYKSKTDSL